MEKCLLQLVEMTKSKKEGDEQFHQRFFGMTERNNSLLAEMNKSQQEGTHQLHQLNLGIDEIKKKQQEETLQRQQQFLEMRAEQKEMLNVLHHLQRERRPQVTAEEVPSVSTKPVEGSSASGNYIPEENTENDKMEIIDSDTDDEGTGGVTSTNERQTLPSQTTRKSFIIRISGNMINCKEDSTSAVIKKLWRKHKLPVICNKKKGVFHKSIISKPGSPSISFCDMWLFPGEFEHFSGNVKSKNWKKSIYVDLEDLKKDLGISDELVKHCRINLHDLLKQRKQKLPKQKIRESFIEQYQHLFQP
ncbi:sp110 nuclear body protein-like isoform X2 [Polypterus senegalus]|nr:sp110 nuclear body protein-like isoform X2 [Polypterus senegalus]